MLNILLFNLLGELLGSGKSLVDVVENILLANHSNNTRLRESIVNILVYTRKDDDLSLFLCRLNEDFEVVDTRRVNEVYPAHTNDADGLNGAVALELLKAVCNTKEEGIAMQ